MTIHLGKVKPGTTLYIPFDTFAGSTGASITMTGLAVTDIEIYKNGGTTQRASDTGYTLLDTDGIDFDALTGIHGFSVDLSSNADSGFFVAGGFYWVVVSAITVDSQTVSFVAATFTIGYDGSVIDTTIATLASQTSFTLTAGPAEDDALNGCTVIIHDIASAVQLGKAIVSDYTGSTKTVTLVAGVTFTAAAGDNISILPPALQAATWGGVQVVQTGDSFARIGATGSGLTSLASQASVDAVDNFVDTEIADIQARLPAALVGGRMDASVGAMAANTLTASALAADAVTEIQSGLATPTNITAGTITTVTNLTNAPTAGDFTATMKTSLNAATPASVQNISAQTGDSFARLGAPAGASVSADIAAIEAQTDDIGVAGAGLTALGDARLANLDAAVSSRLASASYTTPPTAAANADAVWDEAIADHLGAGSTGLALNSAGAAGDPWSTAIPGAYGAGTAGKILGDNLNATVSSRSSHSAADVWAAVTRTLTAASDSSGITTLLSRIVGTLATGTHQPQSGDAYARIGAAGAGLTALGDTRIANLDAAVSTRSTYAGGAVASVTAPVTVGTNSDKTGYALTAAYDLAKTASQAGDAMALTSGERTTLTAVVWAYVIEGTHTAVQYMRLMASALLAKLSGAATATNTFRDVDDTKNRITATVDADGNRSAVTLDGS